MNKTLRKSIKSTTKSKHSFSSYSSLFSQKKGFSPGQIFTYSLSLVIVSLILIYGYSVVTDFIGDSSTVEILQFKKLMEESVHSYSTEYGSIGTRTFKSPSQVGKICFTDYQWPADQMTSCEDGSLVVDADPLVEASFGTTRNEREKKNLFLFSHKDEFIESYYLGEVSLKDATNAPCSYLCMDSFQGKFTYRIEGKGDSATIFELRE